MVKNLPATREDPLEEGMATHSSILAWRIHMDRGDWQAIVWGRKESDTTERLSTSQTLCAQRFLPTPYRARTSRPRVCLSAASFFGDLIEPLTWDSVSSSVQWVQSL